LLFARKLCAKLQQNYQQIYLFAQKINSKERDFKPKTNKQKVIFVRNMDICEMEHLFYS